MLFFSRKHTLLSFILLLWTSSLAPSSSAAYRPFHLNGNKKPIFDASVIVESEQGRRKRNKEEEVSDSSESAKLYTLVWVVGVAGFSHLISRFVNHQSSNKKITA